MKSLSRRGRGILREFREFIARGNVIDMAVGVVVGGGFTAIVNALVANIITPIIGLMVGGMDMSVFKLVLRPATAQAEEVAIHYGAFIQQLISFLIIAASVFAVVKAINIVAAKGGMLIGLGGREGDRTDSGAGGDLREAPGTGAAGQDAAIGAGAGSAEASGSDAAGQDVASGAETNQLLREIRDLLRAGATDGVPRDTVDDP